jgi:hypothetical protein
MQSLGSLSFDEAYKLSLNTPMLVKCFQETGVLYHHIACPDCGSGMSMQVFARYADGLCWHCTKKACGKRVTIRKDSYFEKSRLPLSILFRILYCYMRYDKMLQKYVADIAGVSENTMVEWGNFMRETISNYFLKNPVILGGKHAVQIDESLFGGRRKYHRKNHNIHEQSWVFGMVEETTNLNVFWLVEDRKRDTLMESIRSHIRAGSIIKSDEWTSYASLPEEGFRHLTVNHSMQFVSADGIHTQLIESLWSQVKSVLKAKRGTQVQHLPGCLDFYSFTCLARHKSEATLDHFLNLIQVGHCY